MKIAKKPNYSLLAGIITCLIWSSGVTLSHKLSTAFGPISTIAWESLIGGTVISFLLVSKKRKITILNHPKKYYFFAGPAWILYQTLFATAIISAPSNSHLVVVGLINYLWPILILLFSIPILKNKFNKLIFPGMILSIIGIVIAKVSFDTTENFLQVINSCPLAYILALFGAIAWALYCNFIKRYACPKSQSALPIFMLSSALPLIIIGKILDEQSTITISNIITLFLWSILVALAIELWDYSIKQGNVVQLATLSMFIPLISTLITCYTANVPISISIVIAGLMVSLGAFLCQKSEVKKPNYSLDH